MYMMNSAPVLLLCVVACSLVQGRRLRFERYWDRIERELPGAVASNDIHLETNAFMPARTCLDYLRHGVLNNGFYWLFDDQGQRYMAFCDLSSEPSSAWTLMMSWDLKSKDLPNFKSKTFQEDAPINHNTPNWKVYRQTLARMKNVRSHSTHWRATCCFNRAQTIDYRDYVRGKFSDLDVMTFLGSSRCLPVEYVNIRGQVAAGTTAQFWQVHNTYLLHIDSSHSNCGFKPNAGAVPSEDNFGYYATTNDKFYCTMPYTDVATTQWWFGGYLSNE